jgi:hypothetical protein
MPYQWVDSMERWREFVREARILQAWVCFDAASQAHARGLTELRDEELKRGCEFIDTQRAQEEVWQCADVVKLANTTASKAEAGKRAEGSSPSIGTKIVR